MKLALLFTANTPQLAASHLMTETLRAKGGVDVDIWVLSTQLSDDAKTYLDRLGIKHFVDPMAWADQKMPWRQIFPDGDDKAALAQFHTYRNKRMSKLLFPDWAKTFGAEYDALAVCDNDLYIQGDLSEVFACAENGKINYAQEDARLIAGNSIWMKDLRYRQITGDWDYDGGAREINIGFVVAQPDLMAQFFAEIRERFLKLDPRLIRDFQWHDQDLARVIRAKRPDLFAEFPADTILHLCGGGLPLVAEDLPGSFRNRLTGATPKIVHFGGGLWKNFPSIAPAYTVEPQAVFDHVLQRPLASTQIRISKAEYNAKTRRLSASGWGVHRGSDVTIVLSTAQRGVIGTPTALTKRPDVERRFPSKSENVIGWELDIPMSRLAPDDTLTVSLLQDGSVFLQSRPVTFT